MSMTQIALLNNLNPGTFEKQYKDKLSDFHQWEKQRNMDSLIFPENFGAHMSIDETGLHNGELYTILTNKEGKGKKGSLAAIIKGTSSKVINRELGKVPFGIRLQVEEMTLDLANNMDWICRTAFLNAGLVGDRFHAQKLVNDAVQAIRIKYRWEAIERESEAEEQWKQENKGKRYEPERLANGDTRKQILARSKYFLYKPEQKWTASQEERAKILFELHPEIEAAYKLAMQFRDIYEKAKTTVEATKLLDAWLRRVDASKVEIMGKTAKSVQSHKGKIIAYFQNRSTNAGAESFNAKLKELRALMRGINDVGFFFYRVMKLYA